MKGALICFFFSFTFFVQTSAQEVQLVTRKLLSISRKNFVEFSPAISADGKILIFETQREDKWELYQSSLDEKGEWSEPYPLTTINEKCSFIAGPSLSYDGNVLYYTAFIEGVSKSEDIYYSERLDDKKWSEPKNIGATINSEDGYEGFPSISSDNNSLYFISVNEEGNSIKTKEPCFMIYVSHRTSDGSWGEPIELPEPINSGCERDPKIMADNRTLIFSSIKPDGKGKYDLYQAHLLPNKTWSAPVPLDFVNSQDNDQAPCISASGDKMFFYSNNDLYEIQIPESYRQFMNVTVQGTVMDAQKKHPVTTSIRVKNKATGEVFSQVNNSHDGKYTIVVSAGQQYEVTFVNNEYLPQSIFFDFSQEKTYREQKQDILLTADYGLTLHVIDKDLKKPISCFAKITEAGEQAVFQDSIFEHEGKKRFPLKSTSQYELSIVADNYNTVIQKLTISPEALKNEVDYIVEVEHEKVKAVADVTDVRSGQRMKMKVAFNNESTGEVIVADAGETILLRRGDRYQVVTTSNEGYSYAITNIEAQSNGSDQPLPIKMPVTQLLAGAKLTLNHVYFETNAADLSKTSALELKSIVELLKNNPRLVIEISAHTDDVGSDDYNLALSQKRALSVTGYINKSGIPLQQLVARGYGKNQPIAPNDSDENRAKNRRVELLILKVN